MTTFQAPRATSANRAFFLDERYQRADGTVFLTGIQALVRMLFDRAQQDRRAGLRTATFVSGYEGSPLAGYDLELLRQRELLTRHDVVFQPAVNEELGATSVAGSQLAARVGGLTYDGVTGVWYGKAPGLDRATDALRHANMIGTHPRGGAVALVGDDPGAKSSTIPSASEALLADLRMPVLVPADSQDILELGVHAQHLSRVSGLWSALKVVTAVADGASTATVHPLLGAPVLGDLGESRHQPSGMVLGASLMAMERSMHEVRLPRALEYARLNGLNRIVASTPGDRVGIVAAGKTYLDVRSALRALGVQASDLDKYGVRLLKLGMIHPLDPQVVNAFTDGLREVVVVEEKNGFVEAALKDLLYGRANAPQVLGKRDLQGRALFPVSGDLDVDSVAAGLARVLEPYGLESVAAWRRRPRTRRTTLPLAVRTPYFCSGCPHNSSTKVDDGTIVGAGIGCHAMVLLMDPEVVGNVVGTTQMGGEGAQWIGISPFVQAKHLVQNIGDGTFLHSGSLAVRAAVAAKVNITYKLLYNSAVAMTGGQHPVGEKPVEAIVRLLLDEGVAKVVITSGGPGNPSKINRRQLPKGVQVRPREDILAVQRELAQVPGVTVLVHDQECAAQKRRKRKRGTMATPTTKVMINERICEGCGDCGAKSNCLSVQPVQTEFGRKTAINQSSCNVDYSCLKGDCPSFMTVTPGERTRRDTLPDLPLDALPHPVYLSGRDEFDMRVMGVGGTGVVTVSQVLATAAVIDGHGVRTLDMTGLAQKGGAVTSDIKMTDNPQELAAKLGEGGADLYLGFDALVATDPANLKVASPSKTIAVVSTTEVPTGKMVTNTSARYPAPGAIHSAVDAVVKQVHYLDAGALAKELFGDEQYANMILVGAALQTGVLPVSEAAIEQAIMLNGVAVERNIQALRRGRQSVADPDGLAALLERPVAKPDTSARARALAAPFGALAGRVALRVDELTAYQDEDYARQYLDFLTWVHRAEAPLGSTALTEAVAVHLHKLMAYKDEYEVARLALLPSTRAEVERQFGTGAKVRYQLHPPALRALGMTRKLSLGSWVEPGFTALTKMRRLRGTALDPFGRGEVRRTERELVGEYRAAVTSLLPGLTAGTLAHAVEVAALPDMVRGYEGVKMGNVAKYRAALKEKLGG